MTTTLLDIGAQIQNLPLMPSSPQDGNSKKRTSPTNAKSKSPTEKKSTCIPSQLCIFHSNTIVEMPQGNPLDLEQVRVLCNHSSVPLLEYCEKFCSNTVSAKEMVYPNQQYALELEHQLRITGFLTTPDSSMDGEAVESFSKYLLHSNDNTFVLVHNFSRSGKLDDCEHKKLDLKLRHWSDISKENEYFALVITRSEQDEDLFLDGDMEHSHFHVTAKKLNAGTISVHQQKFHVRKYHIPKLRDENKSTPNSVFYRLGQEPIIRHCPAPACFSCELAYLYSKVTSKAFIPQKHPCTQSEGLLQTDSCKTKVQFYRTFYGLPEMRLTNEKGQVIDIPLSFMHYDDANLTQHWTARKRKLTTEPSSNKKQKM